MDQAYFAYGSNLLLDQMIERTGFDWSGNERPRIARLPNYRVAFNMLADDGQVYANIIQPGDGVFGVVYRCRRESLEKLDRYERGYQRQEMVVFDEMGIELQVFVYIALPENRVEERTPTAAYLDRIVTGARQHGLTEDYIHSIELSANCERLEGNAISRRVGNDK